MPSWSFTRRREPEKKRASSAQPTASKNAPAITPQPTASHSGPPARRAADAAPDGRSLQAQFEEATATQARLRQDLAELLKAHRQQGRVLERNQKLLEQTEHDVNRHRTRATALEAEIGEQRMLAEQHARRVQELELVAAKHATLETAYESL